MAYGTQQLLGTGFDPSMLRQDFSGFVNAAAIRGQTMANLGESIGGVLKLIGEKRKEQQDQEKEVLKSAKLASSIAEMTADPGMKQSLIGISASLQDKERPLSERVAEASVIPALIQYQTSAMRATGFGNISGVVDVPIGGGTVQKMFYNKQGRLTPVVGASGGGGGGGAFAPDGSVRQPITEAQFQEAGIPLPPGGEASGDLLPPLPAQQGQDGVAAPTPNLADDIEILADQEIGPPPDDAVSMAIEQLGPGQTLSEQKKSALEKQSQAAMSRWESNRDRVGKAKSEVENARIKIAADIQMLSKLDPNFNAEQALIGVDQQIQDSLIRGGVGDASIVARRISAQLGSQVAAAEKAPSRELEQAKIEGARAKAATEQQKVEASKRAFEQYIATYDNLIQQVKDIYDPSTGKTVEGFSGVVGAKGAAQGFGIKERPFGGTKEAGAMARIDQVKGGIFLQAFQSLKGGGAITEREGEAATKAYGRLSTDQSEEDFNAALKDLVESLERCKQIYQQNQSPKENQTQSPNQQAPVQPQTTEDAAAQWFKSLQR